MSVKSLFTIRKNLNTSYLCFMTTCILSIVSVIITRVPNEKLVDKQVHLALRSIGDALLKFNADFSTPVPPIQQKGSETYSLKFDTPVVIDPDHLVELSLKHLTSEIARQSIVTVRNVDTGAIVYGFEIDHLEQMDIPCLGRILSASNYSVEFSFFDDPVTQLLYYNIPAISTAGVYVLFAFLGFSFLKKKKHVTSGTNQIQWKGIILDIAHNQITKNRKTIQLTTKESQILAILLEHKGTLVTRAFFMQEVWLKKGVITERSLDMYISRLRKKMAVLSNVQIVNQHGKGYYLRTL